MVCTLLSLGSVQVQVLSTSPQSTLTVEEAGADIHLWKLRHLLKVLLLAELEVKL